jgi:hypothetical protein
MTKTFTNQTTALVAALVFAALNLSFLAAPAEAAPAQPAKTAEATVR